MRRLTKLRFTDAGSAPPEIFQQLSERGDRQPDIRFFGAGKYDTESLDGSFKIFRDGQLIATLPANDGTYELAPDATGLTLHRVKKLGQQRFSSLDADRSHVAQLAQLNGAYRLYWGTK